jgi:hypothetical protein
MAIRTTEVAEKISATDTMSVMENKPVFESVPVVQAVTAVERSPSDVRRKASTCCDKTTVDKSSAVTARSALGGPGRKLKSDGNVSGGKIPAVTVRSALEGPGGKPKSDDEKPSPADGTHDGRKRPNVVREAFVAPGPTFDSSVQRFPFRFSRTFLGKCAYGAYVGTPSIVSY